MPDRHGPLRTPVGWFTERVNGGAISDGAVVVHGSDLGLGELELPFLDGFGPVAGEQASILAPAGIRTGEQMDPDDLLVLIPGAGSRADELSVAGSFYEGPVSAFLTGRTWLHSDDPFLPNPRWLHDDAPFVAGEEGRVLVALGDRDPAELFTAADTGNNPFDTGNNPFSTGNNPFDTGNNPFLVAAPGSIALPEADAFSSEDLFDAGQLAPLGGATFGMSVLSMPDATVAGQSAIPLVGMDTKALLEHEAARRMLGRAGVTDADEVEWLAGPRKVADVPDGTAFTLLGESGELEVFKGVLAGSDRGSWFVRILVARATPDDHVVVAGVQRAPIGSADGRSMDDTDIVHVEAAVRYMSETVGRLVTE